MSKKIAFLSVLLLTTILALPWSVGAFSDLTIPNVQTTPSPTGTPDEQKSWIWLDLPPDATQLVHGQEIYRLVCSACHAYDGTGLTDEWRSTWNPEDQNCWQSKCHAENHPPDGFFLPYSPAVVGPVIPALFETAYDLYIYNEQKMPWHNPNSLTDEEVWAVTAYLLKLNGYDPSPNLNAETAKQMQLRRVGAPLASSPTVALLSTSISRPVSTSTPDQGNGPTAGIPGTYLGLGITLAILGALAGYIALKRRT